MKGRGTRVPTASEMQAVSGEDARTKDHFVIVDAGGDHVHGDGDAELRREAELTSAAALALAGTPCGESISLRSVRG